ncbi:baseplate J/gp47 family protein [Algoriphagus taiwanensis]|uniref:Baseplate J-like protein n=1 Tax=Algoriphagus taiwanensis TaxID=1445656 RepID=A0ABQ6Q0R4_9BACT|nr:hypothetical protein Ataiwa_20360 [Algoriphagus taiwanensis]
MSTDSCHSVHVPHPGTHQANRLLESLLPDYVAVDERSLEELKQFATQLAFQLKFIEPSGDTGKDWKSFFTQDVQPEQLTAPHFSLFLAFLQNYTLLQKDLNTLTRRHLDFFYRDVLRIREKSPEPDQAYLIIQLAKHVGEYLIPSLTSFKAGKDGLGLPVSFRSQANQAVNKAEVADIKALYRDEFSRFYASPIANSEDGLGGEIIQSEGGWSPFGIPKSLFPESDRSLAVIGFAVSSPVLALAEGERKISLSLLFHSQDQLLENLNKLNLNASFRFWLSGEKTWIEAQSGGKKSEAQAKSDALKFINSAKNWQDIAGIEPQAGPIHDDPEMGSHRPFSGYDIGEVTAKNILAFRDSLASKAFQKLEDIKNVRGLGDDKYHDLIYSFQKQAHQIINRGSEGIELTLNFSLSPEQESVVGYDQRVLIQHFSTTQPVLKVELAPTAQSYAYPMLQNAKLKSVKLVVDVVGVQELVLQNDQTVLPVGKNIHPFGFRPTSGSHFYIGSREVFSKDLNSLSITAEWAGLPGTGNGFQDHYQGYLEKDSRTNLKFKVEPTLLKDRAWIKHPKNPSYFLSLFGPSDAAPPLSETTLTLDGEMLQLLGPNPELEEIETWSPDKKRGFLRLSLINPDFGHRDFPVLFAGEVLKKLDDPDLPLPKEPYTPELKSVSLSYTAEDSFQPNSGKWSHFFHIGPFGEALLQEKSPEILPSFSAQGELLIGLKNHLPGQSIQLLFHILDGSGNPEKPVPTVSWSYLSGNQWVPVDKLDLVLDQTRGLIQTGLIQFTLPKAADSSHTLLPNGHTWLKASVSENADALPKLTQILAQAIQVTFDDQQNDPNRLAQSLPEGTITKLTISQNQISKISQPFASFGGKMAEAEGNFYTRVSERLRHKQRAITKWDYEHLVLEEFPEVYQVKALNHTFYEGNLQEYRALAPRHVTLVIIANVQNRNALDPLRPKASVSLLSSIKEMLLKKCSPGVLLHVVNPVYEELQIKTKVRFLPGVDQSIHTKKLEDDLKAFLSPWAFEPTDQFQFEGEIQSSVILHFIEKLTYVDFLSCFELYHLIKNPVNGQLISRTRVEEGKGSRGVSILGSVGTLGNYGDHLIEVLETEACECEDNVVPEKADILSSESSDMEEKY